MKTAQHGKGLRYKVRWLDPEGAERSKSFPDGQLKAARDFRSKQEVDMALGDYIDPKAGKVTVAAFAKSWLADLDVDELSRQNMEMRFRKRVIPCLGKAEIGSVKPSAIRNWDRLLREDGLSDRYRHTLFGNVSAMFTAAMEDGLISKHPCRGKSVKQPKAAQKKIIPWPEARVWTVQRKLKERFRVTVDMAAGIGLRQGEVFGLAVEDVDFLRGVVHVRRQVKTVRYKHVFALPKYDKTRDVPLPEPVKLALAEHIRRFPPREITLPWDTPDGKPTMARLIVTSVRGLAVAANDFNRNYWKVALKAADVPFGRYENGMHELRHFFASVLLDQGESIKAVAEWLGHADPSFTLKIYTHLMPSSADRTKNVIGNLYGRRPETDSDGPGTAQDDQQAE
ncbi:tyrosine-type recombinase/integrase [Actinophytocola algeriensis]|uniref:Integrase n=1 Tax=Actinophytocola algeriensis TaxID=1768010 RepID=A0A7W7PZD6_9PSEU|nr:site-specific integrase [Actinophytocola algeriensis]MBB4903986.1 integrase [Actinophytocola algeriensis]MBE1477157.1 integrase [Actinophytocola algeriensis]